MTDETSADGQIGDGQPQAPSLEIGHQYIKDFSFEIPGAPRSFEDRKAPEVGINLNVLVDEFIEGNYEVVLHIDARGDLDGKPFFIVELDYAGLFRVSDMPAEHLQAFLRIEPPRLLFPFARSIIANTTRDGGLPPLMLNAVDFVNLYKQTLAAANEGAG